MKQQFLAVVLLAGVSGMASAAAPEEGWFAGASYGLTKIDDKAFRGETDVVSTDDKDTSVQLWGGYRLADWVSVEGRYSMLGEYVSQVDDGTPGGSENKSEAEALSAHIKLILPFGNSGVDIYGQLGLGIAKWKSDLTIPDIGQPQFSTSENEPMGSYGVGIRWTVIPRLTLQFAVDAYQFSGSGAVSYTNVVDPGPPVEEERITNQVKFDADILTTSLGVQYNF